MKTPEEIAIKRGLYNYFTGNADEKVIQAMEEYATEAIKADREKVAENAGSICFTTEDKHGNTIIHIGKKAILNLPIELK